MDSPELSPSGILSVNSEEHTEKTCSLQLNHNAKHYYLKIKPITWRPTRISHWMIFFKEHLTTRVLFGNNFFWIKRSTSFFVSWRGKIESLKKCQEQSSTHSLRISFSLSLDQLICSVLSVSDTSQAGLWVVFTYVLGLKRKHLLTIWSNLTFCLFPSMIKYEWV